MRISVFSGASSIIWQLVCSIQPLFNVFFQNYLGATASQLGFLVMVIQAAGAFQILGIFLYGWIGRQKPIFIVGHVIHRSLTAIIAFVAFYVARGGSNERGIAIIIAAMGLSWIFANSTSACWWGWVADIFPESTRGEFFMKRSSIIQIVNLAWFFLASMLLDVFPKDSTLTVFGVIMSVGAACGLVDILSQLPTPEPLPDVKPDFDAHTVVEPLKNKEFVRYAVAIGLATFSMNLVTPFQAPYVVDPARIGAPNTWLGIMQMLYQLLWIMCAPFWGTVMDRWGRKPVVISGTLLSLGWVGYLALTGTNYFIVLPIIAVFTGVLAPAFWEGSNQMMLSLAPEKNRVSYVAWYLAIVGLVSAPGSLAGGILTDALSGFGMRVGPIAVTNFHVTQALSIILCAACAFLISRVREGSEKPFGFVIGQIANPQIIRTFQNLDTLSRSRSIESSVESLRAFDGKAAELAIRDIVEKLDDPDASVQEEAARALGRIPSQQSVDALILRLLDPLSDIRSQAARALGRIADRKAVGALVGCLWERDEELQKACLEALADIGDEESIAQVLAFLRENNSDRLRKTSSSVAARLGVFEAAWEIFPSLLSARTKTARRQYAIALASLLGPRDGFYQYTSGSASSLHGRQKRLVARFAENMLRVGERSRRHGDGNAGFGRDDIDLVARAFEEDRNADALEAMVCLSKRMLAGIFGENPDREMLGRLDRKLEIFSWMMGEAQKYLDAPGERSRADDVEDTARTVTLVAMYFLAEY